MIYSRQYSRQLIVLKNVTSTKAGGRCVIEIKNSQARLIVNTYSLSQESVYKICFVMKNSGHRAFVVGEILAGVQKIITFDPDDISGNKIEDMAAVAILSQNSNVPVLAGFTGDFTDLRGGIAVYSDKKSMAAASVKKFPKQPQKTEKSTEKPTEKTENAMEETPLDENIHYEKNNEKAKKEKAPVDFMEMFGKFRKEMEELEKMAFSPEDNKAESNEVKNNEILKNIAEETVKNEEIAENNVIKLNNDAVYEDYLTVIRKTRENAEPYIKNSESTKWYKVAPAELAAIDCIPANIIMHPLCSASYKKYGCVLLGINDKNNRYLVGIPSEDPVFQNSPFRQTIPSDNGRLNCHICTIN